ncbi:MAG: type II toxin-antitoxin system prevent-host-death family antitoxin [Nitrospirae bacterium]|nr:type II toxin-antitoxin system prevent-host-death family antitoxin [Nitrospirota bacterium]
MSALIDKVRHGESILIMDRNNPVARLEPVFSENETDDDARLARLEREGIIRRAPVRAPESIIGTPPPKTRHSLLKSLLADREEGR